MVGEEGDPFYMLEKPRGTTRILNITKQVSRQVFRSCTQLNEMLHSSPTTLLFILLRCPVLCAFANRSLSVFLFGSLCPDFVGGHQHCRGQQGARECVARLYRWPCQCSIGHCRCRRRRRCRGTRRRWRGRRGWQTEIGRWRGLGRCCRLVVVVVVVVVLIVRTGRNLSIISLFFRFRCSQPCGRARHAARLGSEQADQFADESHQAAHHGRRGRVGVSVGGRGCRWPIDGHLTAVTSDAPGILDCYSSRHFA